MDKRKRHDDSDDSPKRSRKLSKREAVEKAPEEEVIASGNTGEQSVASNAVQDTSAEEEDSGSTSDSTLKNASDEEENSGDGAETDDGSVGSNVAVRNYVPSYDRHFRPKIPVKAKKINLDEDETANMYATDEDSLSSSDSSGAESVGSNVAVRRYVPSYQRHRTKGAKRAKKAKKEESSSDSSEEGDTWEGCSGSDGGTNEDGGSDGGSEGGAADSESPGSDHGANEDEVSSDKSEGEAAENEGAESDHGANEVENSIDISEGRAVEDKRSESNHGDNEDEHEYEPSKYGLGYSSDEDSEYDISRIKKHAYWKLDVTKRSNALIQHLKGLAERITDNDTITAPMIANPNTVLQSAQTVFNTFHPFSRLPAELRLQIWSLSRTEQTKPHILRVTYWPDSYSYTNYRGRNKTEHIGKWVIKNKKDLTPFVSLAVCRESRFEAIKSRFFQDYQLIHLEHDAREQQAWFNFKTDTYLMDTPKSENEDGDDLHGSRRYLTPPPPPAAPLCRSVFENLRFLAISDYLWLRWPFESRQNKAEFHDSVMKNLERIEKISLVEEHINDGENFRFVIHADDPDLDRFTAAWKQRMESSFRAKNQVY